MEFYRKPEISSVNAEFLNVRLQGTAGGPIIGDPTGECIGTPCSGLTDEFTCSGVDLQVALNIPGQTCPLTGVGLSCDITLSATANLPLGLGSFPIDVNIPIDIISSSCEVIDCDGTVGARVFIDTTLVGLALPQPVQDALTSLGLSLCDVLADVVIGVDDCIGVLDVGACAQAG